MKDEYDDYDLNMAHEARTHSRLNKVQKNSLISKREN